MHSFWKLRQALFRRVSPVLKELHGLELPEVFLLEYIGKSDLSPSEIAARMRLPAHAISRRSDVLEKRLLIVRSLKEQLARVGYDPVFGARPLKRAIQQRIETPLSRLIIAGDLAEGDDILVEPGASGFTFEKPRHSEVLN